MLTPSQIAQLVAHAQVSGVARLSIEVSGCNLELEFHADSDSDSEPKPQAVPSSVSRSPMADLIPVRTAGFGRFFSTHPLASMPFVKLDDVVCNGDVLGLQRTGVIFRAIRAPCEGKVGAVLVEPDTLTGHGQEVLRLRIQQSSNE
jgi:biotin carboxyl carrier protein